MMLMFIPFLIVRYIECLHIMPGGNGRPKNLHAMPRPHCLLWILVLTAAFLGSSSSSSFSFYPRLSFVEAQLYSVVGAYHSITALEYGFKTVLEKTLCDNCNTIVIGGQDQKPHQWLIYQNLQETIRIWIQCGVLDEADLKVFGDAEELVRDSLETIKIASIAALMTVDDQPKQERLLATIENTIRVTFCRLRSLLKTRILSGRDIVSQFESLIEVSVLVWGLASRSKNSLFNMRRIANTFCERFRKGVARSLDPVTEYSIVSESWLQISPMETWQRTVRSLDRSSVAALRQASRGYMLLLPELLIECCPEKAGELLAEHLWKQGLDLPGLVKVLEKWGKAHGKSNEALQRMLAGVLGYWIGLGQHVEYLCNKIHDSLSGSNLVLTLFLNVLLKLPALTRHELRRLMAPFAHSSQVTIPSENWATYMAWIRRYFQEHPNCLLNFTIPANDELADWASFYDSYIRATN